MLGDFLAKKLLLQRPAQIHHNKGTRWHWAARAHCCKGEPHAPRSPRYPAPYLSFKFRSPIWIDCRAGGVAEEQYQNMCLLGLKTTSYFGFCSELRDFLKAECSNYINKYIIYLRDLSFPASKQRPSLVTWLSIKVTVHKNLWNYYREQTN